MSRVVNWVCEWTGHCWEPQIKFEVNESNNRGDSSTGIRGDSKEATPVGACSGICKCNASSDYVQQTCCWTQYVTRPGLSLPPVCRPPSTFLGWISKAGNWPILSTVWLNKVRSGRTFRIWLLWCCEWQLDLQTSKANISCCLPFDMQWVMNRCRFCFLQEFMIPSTLQGCFQYFYLQHHWRTFTQLWHRKPQLQ